MTEREKKRMIEDLKEMRRGYAKQFGMYARAHSMTIADVIAYIESIEVEENE